MAALRKKALKNAESIVCETFEDLIDEGWLVPLNEPGTRLDKCWYLPFFVSRHAATCNGIYLNDAVLPGLNLLNGLVEVLVRFRLGRFSCMTDLSKCFFQVSIPREQQDLFHLIWYGNNDFS